MKSKNYQYAGGQRGYDKNKSDKSIIGNFFSPTRTPVISVSGDVNNMIVESAEAEHV